MHPTLERIPWNEFGIIIIQGGDGYGEGSSDSSTSSSGLQNTIVKIREKVLNYWVGLAISIFKLYFRRES